jgi:O-antigen/teichoic acid export membrane protein
MDKKKIIVNIFSNWTNFIVTILIAFFVSPIIVHSLGNENYGIWTLIVSITGYFTVLDFGVNTAIVRYISKYTATKEYDKANRIYSTAFIFFIIVALFVLIVTTVFAFFFKDFFNIQTLSRKYLYFVFFIVGTDLAFNFVFSVYQATLRGLQDFLKVNIIAIITLVIKNAVLVIMLLNGYNLMSLAFIQLFMHLFRALLQYSIIRKNYEFLSYQWKQYDKSVLKQIYHYSIYSFIISMSIKVLFFTDSVVIGKLIEVSEVTFYAIPAMILQYSEKIIYAVVAVLVPVISSYDAVGEHKKNMEIYIYGSKYSLILSIPIIFVLYTKGADFISLWMGEEYGQRAYWVLKILIIGYGFAFPQMIAQGILKGISRHKVFAYILALEAVANLVLSILLAPKYGIEGVALGTAVPLIAANLIIVPLYTCHVLKFSMLDYLFKAYLRPLIVLAILVLVHSYITFEVSSYVDFMSYTLGLTFLIGIISAFIVVEKTHREWVFNGVKNKIYK